VSLATQNTRRAVRTRIHFALLAKVCINVTSRSGGDFFEDGAVEVGAEVEVGEREGFVRAVGVAVGERETEEKRVGVEDAFEIGDDGDAAALADERRFAAGKELPQGFLRSQSEAGIGID